MKKHNIILLSFVFILFFFPLKLNGNNKIDSLLSVLGTSDEISKIDVLTALAWENRVYDPVNTIKYGIEALKYAKKFKKKEKYSKIISFISTGYRNIEDYNKAAEYCLKGLNFAIEEKDKKEIAYCYHTLSTIYLFQKNYKETLKYLDKSFNIFNELNDTLGLGYCYHSYGNIYTIDKKYKLALKYFNKALKVNIDNNSKSGSAKILSEIGELYYSQDKYNKALEFFNKSLKLFLDINLISKAGNQYANIAKSYLHLNNINEAIKYAHKSLKIGEKLELDNIKSNSTIVLSEGYNKLKNFKKAFYYQQLFVKAKISLINKRKNKQIYEIQAKYESESKDLNIEILEKEKSRQNLIIISFIGFSVLLIFVLVFLFYNNRQKRKSNTLLENAKKELIVHSEELEELNRKLIASEIKLKSSNESKNKLFSIISHDLINSINSILGFSDILYKEYDIFNKKEIKKYLKLINDSSKNLYYMVDNLLQWSRNQLDHIKYTPNIQCVKDAIDELSLVFINDLKNKKIKFKIDVSETILAYCDFEILKVVIRNLLSNAIKFTNPRGEIMISAKEKDKYIEISVSDTGVGISEENIDKLFKDEISFTSRGTKAEKGTGLGLVICRDFININKGKIWAESKKGNGSVFTFTLPRFKED